MNLFQLIIRSFRHYLKSHLAVAAGIAISTAVITGSLIVGDSIAHSLMKSASLRLGKITHVVHAGDRYFTSALAGKMADGIPFLAAPALQLEGIAVTGGGRMRLNRVQVWGLEPGFNSVAGDMPGLDSLLDGEAIISSNVAERLGLASGDYFQIRIRQASPVPSNAPFVSDVSTTTSQRIRVKEIADEYAMGRLNMRISQTAPYNVFLNLDWLSRIQKMDGQCNRILISAEERTESLITESLRENWTARDAALELKYLPDEAVWKISSPRVFIDSLTSTHLLSGFPGAEPVLTYFANSIGSGEKQTPYSFVAGISGTGLKEDEILINQWLAEDLEVSAGDTVALDYFVIGPLRKLEEVSRSFIVREIVPMIGPYGDRELAPFIPGLSDAGNCSEWEAGVPIDLDMIRDKDEAYWNEYRGTPKAFVSMAAATKMWKNRFGVSTSIRMPAAAIGNHRPGMSNPEPEVLIVQGLSPEGIGFEVNSMAEEASFAAANGVDFSQLFTGLSFFVLISGIMLTLLLLQLNMMQRSAQTGTLNALGWPSVMIRRTVLMENAGMILLGTLLGAVLAIFYTRLVFAGLNRLWFDIVRTTVLEIHLDAGTFLMGISISMLLAFSGLYLYTRRLLRRRPAMVQRGEYHQFRPGKLKGLRIAAGLLLLTGVVLIISQVSGKGQQNPGIFFMAGGLMLVSVLLFSYSVLEKMRQQIHPEPGLSILIRRNLSHNLPRSMIIIVLMTLGTFLVLSTGANRKNPFQSASDKKSGTGGFQFFAASTMPVLHDLNDPDRRREAGLMVPSSLVQFRVNEGDDASCLNLNRIANPRIIATNPELLNGRFSFVSTSPHLDPENPWSSLEKELPGVVPAIADQTVIQWGLGKKVGDTLYYPNERGETLRLLLIGGLAPSVFQGNVLISDQQFLRNFPSSSGSNVFLVEGAPEEALEIQEDLSATFRDLGWEIQPAAARLAAFNSVSNTYLSIFLVMGTFGLLIGTIGLAVVLVRSLHERKFEIAVLIACGYSLSGIRRIINGEYVRLLLAGILGGTLTAGIATLPAFITQGSDISPVFPAVLAGIIILNGWGWIQLLSRYHIRKINALDALRNE